jgi:hypothetical protein
MVVQREKRQAPQPRSVGPAERGQVSEPGDHPSDGAVGQLEASPKVHLMQVEDSGKRFEALLVRWLGKQ